MTTDDWISSFYELLDMAAKGFSQSIPDEVERRFGEIAHAYAASGPVDRATMRASLPDEFCDTLLCLGDRQVDWALESRNPVHLQDALAAHAIEDFRWDPRENYLSLADIWNCYEELRVEPKDRFLDRAFLFSPQGEKEFTEWVNGPDFVKTPYSRDNPRKRWRPVPWRPR